MEICSRTSGCRKGLSMGSPRKPQSGEARISPLTSCPCLRLASFGVLQSTAAQQSRRCRPCHCRADRAYSNSILPHRSSYQELPDRFHIVENHVAKISLAKLRNFQLASLSIGALDCRTLAVASQINREDCMGGAFAAGGALQNAGKAVEDSARFL